MHTMLLDSTSHHQFRALVAEVVREEYGREVVLAGVEEEALEYHSTRSPGPAAEECFRTGLLEQGLRRVYDAPVRLLRYVALLAPVWESNFTAPPSTRRCLLNQTHCLIPHRLARLDRVHRVREGRDDDAAPQSAGHGRLRFTVARLLGLPP